MADLLKLLNSYVPKIRYRFFLHILSGHQFSSFVQMPFLNMLHELITIHHHSIVKNKICDKQIMTNIVSNGQLVGERDAYMGKKIFVRTAF